MADDKKVLTTACGKPYMVHENSQTVGPTGIPRNSVILSIPRNVTEEKTQTFRWNPFDVTKIWPQGEFPLIDVGTLELNQIPSNFFAEVKQAAFAPAQVVDGIGYSPDKMLQRRLLSYPDAQRYRLGVNYEQWPVNRCPYATNNYQRDGSMGVVTKPCETFA